MSHCAMQYRSILFLWFSDILHNDTIKKEQFIENKNTEKVMLNYQDYITIESGKRSGKPCIRGLRITVYDILNMLADGMTFDEIIDDFPKITKEDILACLSYAADREHKRTLLSA